LRRHKTRQKGARGVEKAVERAQEESIEKAQDGARKIKGGGKFYMMQSDAEGH
jgi:hypothetical protein